MITLLSRSKATSRVDTRHFLFVTKCDADIRKEMYAMLL